MTLFEDLDFKVHPLGSGIHALMDLPNGKWVSIIGGHMGFHGDGIETFEVMTSNSGGDVLGYVTIKGINDILIDLQLGEDNMSPNYNIKKHKLVY
jgi:hypothetical protein